jgi:iron(III) transport system substrate-binding protein
VGGVSTVRRRWPVLLFVAFAAVLIAALAGTASAGPSPSTTSAAPKPVEPLSAAAWRRLVARAKVEGSVTIYSVQSPAGLQDMANAFKARYGITVNVNRGVDSTLLAQINAEHGTGKAIADIWVPSPKRYVIGAVSNKWVVDAVGPNFFKKAFDRKTYMVSKGWIVGTAVLGMAWNTNGYSGAINSPNDFTGSAFNGRIGVPDARVSPSFMDWYLWAEAKYGANYLSKLAALRPKIYTSTLPMTQAVASGEIIGAPCAAGTAVDLKSAGAPIDYKVLNDNWNAPYYGMILKQAPHPAAAQLLANFLISPTGQGLVDRGFGAIYPGIKGTYYAKPRIVKLNDFTPAKVAAFNARWAALFVR